MVARASGSPVAKPTGCLVSGQTGLVPDGAGCVQEGEEPKLLKKIAATVAIVGVLAGLGAFGALSVFTSTATVPDNAFTTGTVKINTSSDDTALITYDNMAPGDKVTQPLTVTNNGSLDLRYAVTSLATDDGKHLRDQLVFRIKSGVTCTNAGFDPGGTLLYPLVGPGVLGGDPAINVIGDPAQYFQTGDRTLVAHPDGEEVLCFQVELPSDTDDDYQGATTTATFTFKAEQTANN
jgi:predicted ribosomally synthesized peptide with SipW-like signal peptide